MPVVCSFCHTHFDPPADEAKRGSHVVCEHCVCPTCKSEIGLELVKPTGKPMKLFGALLATGGFLVVVVSCLIVVAG
jgi:hypothetical protein